MCLACVPCWLVRRHGWNFVQLTTLPVSVPGCMLPRKLIWQWNIAMFDRRCIFIHGPFSIAMLVFGCVVAKGVIYILARMTCAALF